MRLWQVGVLAVLLPAHAQAGEGGELRITPTVNGTVATEKCSARVYAAGSQGADKDADGTALVEGDAHQPLEVPAGKVDVVTACPTRKGLISVFSPGVGIRAGKTTELAVTLENAAVVVHGNNNGDRVQGDVTVFIAGTTLEVAKGLTGNRLEVAAGNHDIRIVGEIEGEPCTVELNNEALAPGRPKIVQADMSNGMLKLVVKRNGAPAEGAGAVTFAGKRHRIKEFTAGEPIALAPGTYDVIGSLSSSFDFAEERKRRVTITPGKVTEVSLNLARGSVATMCELDGKEAPARIYGYLPGASDHFNFAECGQVLELSPGKYHLKVVLDAEKAGYKVLGGGSEPEVWHRNIVVRKQKSQAIKVDFSPARFKVLARRNGELVDAAVTLINTGGPKAGGGPAWEELPVPPGRYDVEVTFPSNKGAHKETIRGVSCDARKVCEVEVNQEIAQLTIEVFHQGAPAPTAQVILFKGGSNVPYTKGKSGEVLEIPPGEYTPTVQLGDSKRQISKMRLAGGAQEVRRVEVE